MFYDRFAYHGTLFEQMYRFYPESFIEKMMESMLRQEGDIVRVKNATLPKG